MVVLVDRSYCLLEQRAQSAAVVVEDSCQSVGGSRSPDEWKEAATLAEDRQAARTALAVSREEEEEEEEP